MLYFHNGVQLRKCSVKYKYIWCVAGDPFLKAKTHSLFLALGDIKRKEYIIPDTTLSPPPKKPSLSLVSYIERFSQLEINSLNLSGHIYEAFLVQNISDLYLLLLFFPFHDSLIWPKVLSFPSGVQSSN